MNSKRSIYFNISKSKEDIILEIYFKIEDKIIETNLNKVMKTLNRLYVDNAFNKIIIKKSKNCNENKVNGVIEYFASLYEIKVTYF